MLYPVRCHIEKELRALLKCRLCLCPVPVQCAALGIPVLQITVNNSFGGIALCRCMKGRRDPQAKLPIALKVSVNQLDLIFYPSSALPRLKGC